MNLQTHIPMSLWEVVESAYEAKNFSHAILDATFHLSSILRDRAGVDGDGATLVGQALGGETPKLKINALETENDKNAQRGIEQILRGIYLGIRNPRSHDAIVDTKEAADSIIHFIGYLVGILNSSKSAFTIESFFDSISDEHFVSSGKYAELVTAEIPALRKGEILIALYRRRKEFDLRKLRNVILVLLNGLTSNQQASYLAVVSDDLKTVTKDAEIRSALQMLKPTMWSTLYELPKLRIETRLIANIKEGAVTEGDGISGSLGTWANSFLEYFSLRREAAATLISLFWSSVEKSHYAAKYFMHHLPKIIMEPDQVDECVEALCICVNADEYNVRAALVERILAFPENWQRKLADGLAERADPDNPAVVLPDGTPFLSSPPKDDWDDEIPF